MSTNTPPEDPHAQHRMQRERLDGRLAELAKKYDISQQVLSTGDLLGALSQVLARAEAELDALSTISATLNATETPDTLSATAEVGRVQLVPGTGSLTMGGEAARVSVAVRATGAKNLSDMYANLSELQKAFINILLCNVIIPGVMLYFQQTPTVTNINTNIQYENNYTVVQVTAAPRRQVIFLRVSHPTVSLLRNAPTLDSQVIASMRTGEVVFWEQTHAEWTKVIYLEPNGDQYLGWVLSAELTEYQPDKNQ